MEKTVTWVVIADHQHGRVLANDGPGRGLRRVERLSFETKLATNHQLVTDRLPRSINSQGGARHSIEPRVDPHRQEAMRFVAQISAAVAAAAVRGEFDRLVIVAPPRALGELRKALPEQVREMVIGELDLDLTKASMKSIRDHVAQFMPL
jgi:protein required for attachment to host cells